ncbi:hypothetical protein LUP59_000273 [Neisseria gonorrhoeae]
MKKALLALTIAAISGTAMAQLPDFLGKGEYTVRTDISKQTLKNADLKEKHKVQKNIGFRADMPFDDIHHGMRFEVSHSRDKKDMYVVTESTTKPFGKDVKEKRTDVYAGYTYTQPISEATKLRAGLGLGYEKYKDAVANEKGTVSTEREAFYTKAHADLTSDLGGWYLNPWAEVKVDLNEKGTVSTEREAFYTKAHADLTSDLGGWYLNPWAEVKVDLDAKLKHNATVAGASADINAKTRGWGVGVGANIGKQITDTVGIEAGPFYKHRHFKASGSFVLDGGNIRVDPTKINEYGVRVGVKF